MRADVLEPFVVAAGALLVVAGVPKVRDPLPLVRALRSVSLPAPAPVARLFAVVEVLLGVAAVVAPVRSVAAGVALFYAGFTAFVLVALSRGGVVESCGCLGRADTPPTVAHVLTTATFAGAAALLLVASPAADAWWSRGPATAVAVGALAALLALVAWVVLAVLPLVTPAAVRSTGKA